MSALLQINSDATKILTDAGVGAGKRYVTQMTHDIAQRCKLIDESMDEWSKK